DHLDDIGAATVEHLKLTLLAVVIGFVIAFPLAVYAFRHRRVAPPIVFVAGLLYTIPSLALFAFLVAYTGLTTTTAEVGLVSYTLLIIIRNTLAGLEGVPSDVKEAATGMGYTPRQLLWKVELPLAVPGIVAGLRIATVTTIGLVTVTAFVGQGGLGVLILEGLQRFFSTSIIVGAVLSMLLAICADRLLISLESRLTPWSKKRAPA
ncbi:MAG: ABC transporter permease, partial [Actinobacteria bacterium]|nr:ABC transporter permease [Actinomycetota bacterium]